MIAELLHRSISIKYTKFTLDDYAEARTKYAAFYEVMTALLHTHTFVCFGCGLSDPDMKLIFEDYLSIGVEKGPPIGMEKGPLLIIGSGSSPESIGGTRA